MDRCRVIRSSVLGMISSMILVFIMAGCASTGHDLKEHAFKVDKSLLVRDVYNIGDQVTPGIPTVKFSAKDSEILSYIKLKNVSGSHYLRWEWYDPQGRLYDTSDNYPISISEGKFVDDLSAVHKISIQGERVQDIPGRWTVYVYYDNDRIANNSFEIEAPAAKIPTPAIAPAPPVSNEIPLVADIDTNIPQTHMNNPDAIAVVIGNRTYKKNKDFSEVRYAQNDAKIMKEYLIKVLGFQEGNILFKLDATKSDFEQVFGIKGTYEGRLFEMVKQGESDVFIYYSGHGAPDMNTKKPYLIPSDCESKRYALSAYPLETLYDNLAHLNARSTTVVLDACFSGGTNGGQLLINEASAFGIKIDNPTIAKANAICMTSSEGDQVSSWYDEKHHGLYTYFFLKGLKGEADKDNNKILTYKELHEYVSDKTKGVPYWARYLNEGRIQIPTMQGVPVSKVLVRY